MYITGVGRVSRQEVSKIFTDGMAVFDNPDYTLDEILGAYKLHLIRQLSIIGSMSDTFSRCYNRIPVSLRDKLSPADLAALVDAFYKCYGDAKERD